MRLLEHVSDRCVEAMREISENPDSFDDRIQEVILCSRIMTGMVTAEGGKPRVTRTTSQDHWPGSSKPRWE